MKCPYHPFCTYPEVEFTKIGLEIHLLDFHRWTIIEVEEYFDQTSGGTQT